MPVETVELSGRGALGQVYDQPAGIRGFLSGDVLSSIKKTVRLGRQAPKKVSKAPEFARFFDSSRYSPPSELDHYSKASASLSRMYANDQYGCCVISGKAHNIGVYTALDSDSGGTILCTDQEIVSEYRAICGPGDNGCNIDAVLRTMKSRGILQGGQYRKIDGYVRVNYTDAKLVKAAIQYFGALTIGFMLPNEWLNSDVWDVTNSRIVGGHDVSVVGWRANGNYVISSWGRLYEMTPAAFHSNRYLDEAYAILSPHWYNSDRIAPGTLSIDFLKTALERIGEGEAPDGPQPQPEPQPEPQPQPAPTKYSVTLTGYVPYGIWGKTAPVTFTGYAVPFDGKKWVGFEAVSFGPIAPLESVPESWSTGPWTYPGEPPVSKMVMLGSGADVTAVPVNEVLAIIAKVMPVILSGIAEGKSFSEILTAVLAVLAETRKAMDEKGRERILTPEQWQRIFDLVLKLLPLFL